MGDFKFEVWPSEHRQITQHFGVNRSNYAQFGLPGHDGIDIRAPTGSKVYCVAPGEVYRVHAKATGHNYGIHVRVNHQDGYQTIYAHLQKVLVQEGQIVDAGTHLGLANNTGNSFGPHLHLTLKRKGAKVGNWPYNIIDPTPFLLPLLGWQIPAGPYAEGWMLADSLMSRGNLGQVNAGGATLYVNAKLRARIPEGTILIVDGHSAPFLRVRVSRAAVGWKDDQPSQPAADPPPIVSTVDGWAWKFFLKTYGNRAVVGPHGIDLRSGPERDQAIIGVVKAGSTVSIRGLPSGRYLPVRVRRSDFIGPVRLSDPPPDPNMVPPAEGLLGWALTQYLSPVGDRLVLTSRFGVNLRNRPEQSGQNIGLIKAFATVSIAGAALNGYTPVMARKEDVLNIADPLPDIQLPEPLPPEEPSSPIPQPDQDSIPGWAFTNGLVISGSGARVGSQGSNLRAAPQRNADQIGFVPAGTAIMVTGPPQGEYTPVRVSSDQLDTTKAKGEDPNSPLLGQARIGLHASADPTISDAEHQEFADLRPGIIKVLSFHSAADIARLVRAHPGAHWIIRAFLSFGGRNIRPDQFLGDTIQDVRRAIRQLKGRQVVVELHNEPNVVAEGLGSSWSDGASFAEWWLELLAKYRRALPGTRFIYPGLSPGSTVLGVKQDHVQFIEASRSAVEAADGLGVHINWSHVFPMGQALNLLDDYISRFRAQPIWVTEASHNRGDVTPAQMAREYLRFWKELQKRPVVQGVTYFVASASNPDFAGEVWLGKGIGKLVGKR